MAPSRGIGLSNNHNEFTKTGAIGLIDQKISAQVHDCTNTYLKKVDFYCQANKWILSLVSFMLVSLIGIVGWSYRPLGEIRELSTKVQVIQTDIAYIKEKLK